MNLNTFDQKNNPLPALVCAANFKESLIYRFYTSSSVYQAQGVFFFL